MNEIEEERNNEEFDADSEERIRLERIHREEVKQRLAIVRSGKSSRFIPLFERVIAEDDLERIRNAMSAIEEFREEGYKVNIENAKRTAKHMMRAIRYGDGCVGISQIATRIKSQSITARKYMDLFCVYYNSNPVAPLFRMIEEHDPGVRARQWEVIEDDRENF